MREVGFWAVAAALAIGAGAWATSPSALPYLGALVIVGVAATAPRLTLYALTPVAMWPDVWIVHGVPVQHGLIALYATGAILGAVLSPNRRVPWKALLLAAGLGGLLLLTLHVHGESRVLEHGQSRNHLYALLASLAIIPAVAASAPPVIGMVRAVALSAVPASLWLLANAQALDNRVALETYNSDGIGQAAAIGIAALWGLAAATRRPIYMLPSLAPLAVFMGAQTRSALVMLGVGLVAWWMLRKPGPSRVAAACIGVAAVPLLAGPAVALQRALFSERSEHYLEVAGRADVLELSLRTMIENPLLGVGYRHMLDESSRRLGMALDPHNDIARIGAEAGVGALVLLLCLLVRTLTFTADSPPETRLLRVLLIVASGTLVFGNVATDPRVSFPLWALLGVAWSLPTRKQQRAYLATQPVLPAPDSLTYKDVPAPPSSRR